MQEVKTVDPRDEAPVMEEEPPLDIASVMSELFAPLGACLMPIDVANVSRTSQTFAERVREELSRRDSAARQFHAWAKHPHWDFSLARICGHDWKQRQWNALPPMNDGRVDALCAVIGNFVYVVGGTRRGLSTNAVERLSLEKGTWEVMPPLLGRRRVDGDAAAAVLGGQLYICGGLNFDNVSSSNCVDRFDPDECYWESMPSMPDRRHGAASAVLDDRLYICGGASTGRSGLEVLSFDPKSGLWESLPPMLGRHDRALAVVANGTIYVGQRDCQPAECIGWTPLSLVEGERFHTNTRTWSRCMGGILSSYGSSVAKVMSSCLFLREEPCSGRPMTGRCLRVAATERSEWPEPPSVAGGRSRVLRRNWTT